MKIRFKTDFANNWKTGDIVDVKYLSHYDALVDGVAIIDIRLLSEVCEAIIDDSVVKEGEENEASN